MNPLLIGNALCFAASILMTVMGFIKKKRPFLAAQCGMNALFIAGNLSLGGIAGALTNAVTLLRNLFGLRMKMSTAVRLGFIALQLALALLFGVEGWISWLPILGTCLFTWFMVTEDMVLLKSVVIFTQLLWALYDYSIRNYATVPFDIFTGITNAVSIVSLLRDRRRSAAQPSE